ncbi:MULTISPECIES: nucleopolyhedrovirus P10 family protein [unclassified Streptomyces]|uniref:nucleopolyhedrovirus P10 family protein n=1 Tax=unclassified Streptomyces TaxID=2593676 RepID=UPI003D75BF15
MTAAESWTQAVRRQVGLGRLLPLGGPADGAWITEDAARAVLRAAAREVRGVRLDGLRLGPADPAGDAEPAVPPPPSGLPPGPLRVTGDIAVGPAEPLPAAAARLRAALADAARQRLGLTVAEVDLRVASLLDEEPGQEEEPPPGPPSAGTVTGDDESRAADAARSVPGVVALTGVLGGVGRSVHLEQHRPEGAALPRRHARVELAVGAGHRAVDVARQVRAAVSEALPDHPTVAVVVTSAG